MQLNTNSLAIEPILQIYHYPDEIEGFKKLDPPSQLKWLLKNIKTGVYGLPNHDRKILEKHYWSVVK